MSIKIYDNIVLFGKEIERYDFNLKHLIKSDLLDFYVSDENNQNTLTTGRNWASRHCKDQDKVVEIHTENKGFKLSLDSSADNSSQGGKLSFWMCRIDKDNIHGRIGINQKELNELFKESMFINGVCQQEVCFYRVNGNVGACVVGGERYKEFYQAKDRDIKLSKAKKTAKWELGRLYETKTTKQVWLGDVTNCLTDEKRHLVLDALGCENTEDIFKQNIFIYDNDLINKFPCKTASDKIFDTSNCSKILAAKQKEKMIKDINDMIDYICNHNYHYILFFDMYLYYIDINDFPKELLIDYLYIYDHYFSLKYGEKYYYNKDYVLVNEILDKFNCAHNIDINKILDKYKKE